MTQPDEGLPKSTIEESNPPLRLLMNFHQVAGGASPQYMLKTPGREMWVAAVVQERNFTLHAPDLAGRTTFSFQSGKQRRTVLNRPLPSWARYPAGVIVQLCASGLDVPGLLAVVVGEEAGMRYDYSIGLTIAALLHRIHEREVSAAALVDIVEKVRREYVEA